MKYFRDTDCTAQDCSSGISTSHFIVSISLFLTRDKPCHSIGFSTAHLCTELVLSTCISMRCLCFGLAVWLRTMPSVIQVGISAGFVPLGGFLADGKGPHTAASVTQFLKSVSYYPLRSSSYSPVRVSKRWWFPLSWTTAPWLAKSWSRPRIPPSDPSNCSCCASSNWSACWC